MRFDFTDRVRKVLAMAREEAIRLGHEHVGTEHLLLGLLRDREGVAAAVLRSLSGAPEQIRARIEGSVRRGPATITLRELPYTSGAKRVLEYTMVEARELNHRYVGTEHLLLGLLREDDGTAAEVLVGCGMTLDRARQETVRLLGTQPEKSSTEDTRGGGWLSRLLSGAPTRQTEPAVFPIGIDDASSLSIYEQIVAQVQEAIATGALRAGDRLPAVRRLAEDLDIAPGTVARAYGELERLGAIVTEGARGTRVANPPERPLANSERPETLAGLLRPVAVAAFHLGASGDELRTALEHAMEGIFRDSDGSSR